jgi:hypothetical protein
MHYGHSAINDTLSGATGADFFSGALSNDVLTDFTTLPKETPRATPYPEALDSAAG